MAGMSHGVSAVAVLSHSPKVMEGGAPSSSGAEWSNVIAKGGTVIFAGTIMMHIDDAWNGFAGKPFRTIKAALSEAGGLT